MLAVGQTFRESSGSAEAESQNVPAKTATLEVSPSEAELLQQGAEAGKLSLSLRGITGADTPITALRVPAGTGGQRRPNSTITIIRYGEVSQVTAAGNQ